MSTVHDLAKFKLHKRPLLSIVKENKEPIDNFENCHKTMSWLTNTVKALQEALVLLEAEVME